MEESIASGCEHVREGLCVYVVRYDRTRSITCIYLLPLPGNILGENRECYCFAVAGLCTIACRIGYQSIESSIVNNRGGTLTEDIG